MLMIDLILIFFFYSKKKSYLIKKGADKEASTIENLRPIDLVEPDNYIAISFLISSSVNCNERHL